MAKTDEELLDEFVFMPRATVTALKAPEIRNLVRGLESLRAIHNGVTKMAMVDRYMAWQTKMQQLKAAQDEENAAKTTEGVTNSEDDADGETDEDFNASESPVTGKVTPGPPLKSPFIDQPRSTKQSPFMDRLLDSSPAARRRAGRSRSPSEEGNTEPEIYKEFEKEGLGMAKR